MASEYKCPHCGWKYPAEPGLVPTHPVRGYATGMTCPGFGQHPRNAESDHRPVWMDLPKEERAEVVAARERHGFDPDFGHFAEAEFAATDGSRVRLEARRHPVGLTPQQAMTLARVLIRRAKEANKAIPEELRLPLDFGLPDGAKADQDLADSFRRRWERLAELIHDDARHIEDEAGEIMAEFAAEPGGPPIYEQIIDRQQDEEARLRAALEMLAQVRHVSGSAQAAFRSNLRLVDAVLAGADVRDLPTVEAVAAGTWSKP